MLEQINSKGHALSTVQDYMSDNYKVDIRDSSHLVKCNIGNHPNQTQMKYKYPIPSVAMVIF